MPSAEALDIDYIVLPEPLIQLLEYQPGVLVGFPNVMSWKINAFGVWDEVQFNIF
jgi:hypothetical protein